MDGKITSFGCLYYGSTYTLHYTVPWLQTKFDGQLSIETIQWSQFIANSFLNSLPVPSSTLWYIRPETRETNPFLEELVGGYGPCVQCHCPSPYKKSILSVQETRLKHWTCLFDFKSTRIELKSTTRISNIYLLQGAK